MTETCLTWVMHYIRWLSAMQAQESLDFTPSSSELRLARPAEGPLGPQNPPLHLHFHTSIRHFSNHPHGESPKCLEWIKKKTLLWWASVQFWSCWVGSTDRKHASIAVEFLLHLNDRKTKKLDWHLYWYLIATGFDIVYTKGVITLVVFWQNFTVQNRSIVFSN